MLPPKVKNLLVAGRCVAGDKTSHAAMRNMMACTVTGIFFQIFVYKNFEYEICVKDKELELLPRSVSRREKIRMMSPLMMFKRN